MSLVVPDSRWEKPELLIPSRKPIGPVILDRTHNLAKELKVAYIMRSDSVARDLVSNNDGILFNMQPNFTHQGIQLDGSNDIIKINSADLNISNIPAAFSFIIRIKANAASQVDKRFFCLGGSTSDLFAFGTEASAPYQRIRTYHTSGCRFDGLWSNRSSIGQPFDGNWTTIGISVKRNEYLNIYIDGVLDSSHYRSSQAGTGDTSYSALGAYIRGSTPNGGSFLNGEIEHFYFYHKELSAIEMFQLAKHPYQIFIPE